MNHCKLEYQMDEWTYRQQVALLVFYTFASVACSFLWFYAGASMTIGLAALMFDTRKVLRSYLSDFRYAPKYRKFAIMKLICLAVSIGAAIIGGFIHYMYRQ